MKLIIAIIQPTKLSAVREALEKIEVTRMTVCDAQGFGRQRGRTEMYRGHEYKTTLLRKVALEIVVNDDFLDRTVETIIGTARTGPEGTIGDGKIFVLPAEQAIQIRRRRPGAGSGLRAAEGRQCVNDDCPLFVTTANFTHSVHSPLSSGFFRSPACPALPASSVLIVRQAEGLLRSGRRRDRLRPSRWRRRRGGAANRWPRRHSRKS